MIGNPGYPWAKIYKREMFNELRFPLDVWFEDTIVCLILFRMCQKMVVTSRDCICIPIESKWNHLKSTS